MTFDLDAHPEFAALWERVAPFTMTSPERGFALWSAVNHVVDAGIPGAIVECGVWKGGSMMLVALTLMARGEARQLFLFDTFAGMTPPGAHDRDVNGDHAADLMAGARGAEIAELVRAEAGLDEVRAAIESTGYDMRLVRLVEGDVAETLPATHTLRIALLRLDTDFYDSTLAELRHLYPRLAQGGVLILDDFGHWQGAARAFADHFADPATPFAAPALWRIDYTGRAGVKAEAREDVEIARYDYRPPGIDVPDLLPHFPHATPADPWQVGWPYLRPEAPHVWRHDPRDSTGYLTGYASVEEAAWLHALARLMAGRRGLEIGTHYGWTAAHLLAAGLELDCIDPEFNDPRRRADVAAALDAAAPGARYRLWGGFSPDLLPEVLRSGRGAFSFAFIDGSHDGDAPRQDALAVTPLLDRDAIVVFHDLVSPFVERGLYAMREAGFRTRLIGTMQILGVAWRGQVEIPAFPADPNVPGIFHAHLAKYER